MNRQGLTTVSALLRASVASLVLGIAGCDKPPQPPPPPRPVLSLVVQPNPTTARRVFTGTVEPRYRAEIGFRMSGRITARSVDVGATVMRGQLLAALDPTVPRLSFLSSQANLSSTKAQLINAAAALQRQQELVRTGTVSQSQVDAALATRNTAQARVDQAQARLQKAQEQLSYVALTSDTDGVVVAWNVEVGQVVSSGQEVVTIARPDARDAVIDVPDSLLERFALGARLPVFLLAQADRSVTGQVREVAPQSDPGTRTRRIRLTLDNPPQAFRLGTTVRIALAAPADFALEVPGSAVWDRDGRTFVWVVAEGRHAMARLVTVGAPVGDRIAVTSGLAPGDRVITAGTHSLSEGQPVRVPHVDGANP